ncbi:MAG: TlpA disulfide reductase family protein [Flavobacteriaceae bacterium]
MKLKSFFKKQGSTLLILLLIVLLFIPQTGTPIKVFLNRLISFSPSEIAASKQKRISSYDWQLEDLEGIPLNFNQSEGKVVLLNVWATWCPPCIAELPSMQNLYDAYGSQVDFYFISLESPETLQRFLQKKGYHIPVYIPKESFPEALSTSSFPTTYVISKTGAMVIDKIGAADWDSEKSKAIIEKLLAE